MEKEISNPIISKTGTLKQKNSKKPCRIPCSWLLFSEFNYLFDIGAKREVTKEDMAPLPPGIRAKALRATILSNSLDQKPFDELIFKMIRPKLTAAIILTAFENILILTISLIPKFFIPQIKAPEEKRDLLIIIACPIAVLILAPLRYIIKEHSSKFMNQSGSMAGQTLRTILFSKMERANSVFLRKADGSIVTKLLMFNFDVFSKYISSIPDYFSFPIILTFSLAFLTYNVGPSSLVIFVVFLFTWVVLIIMIKLSVKEELELEFCTSQRTTLVFELLAKMRTIKSEGFESYYEKLIDEWRAAELRHLHRGETINSIISFFIVLSGILSLLTILIMQIYVIGQKLDVTTTFTIVSLIGSLQKPLSKFENILSTKYRYDTARNSLNYFLMKINDKPMDSRVYVPDFQTGSFSLEHCSASIEDEDDMQERIKEMFSGKSFDKDRPTKTNPIFFRESFTINSHEKVCVVGPEGSDMDAFLYTLMGETQVTEGRIRYRGKFLFADADESSFLTGKSIRENILMGEELITQRYSKVLDVVGFDLKKYPGGDLCQVLERGLNFSSSERRKIVLARMLYIAGDVYIMKDFFGYTEPQSELPVYRRVVEGFLSEKTVLVVTNVTDIVRRSNKIIYFSMGKIRIFNTFTDFEREVGEEASEFLDSDFAERNISKTEKSLKRINLRKKLIEGVRRVMENKRGKYRLFKGKNDNFISHKDDGKQILLKLLPGMQTAITKHGAGDVIEEWDESHIFKKLSSQIFRYLFYLGYCRIIFLFILFLMSVALYIGVDIWVGLWSTKTLPLDTMWYIGIYMIVSLAAPLFSVLRDKLFSSKILLNAKVVHKKVVNAFLNLSLSWINTHPTCELDYKLSYDLRSMDTNVNKGLQDLIESFVFCLGGMIILNYIYLGGMLIATIIIGLYAYITITVFLKTTNSFINFIAEGSSLLQEVYNETIGEIFKYRLLQKTNLIQEKFDLATDEMQRSLTHFAFFSKRWLGIRIGFVNTALILCGYLLPIFIVIFLKGVVNVSTFEIAISSMWSLKIVELVNTFIRNLVELHSQIISFGRLDHFEAEAVTERSIGLCVSTDRELPNEICKISKGNLVIGQREVLKDVNFKLKKGSMVAIAGESGAGKHVLIDLILGIYQSPKVKHFGILQSEIKNKSIRSLTMTLYEFPILYSGTFRDNIDPEKIFSDDTIIHCLMSLDHINSRLSGTETPLFPIKNIILDTPDCNSETKRLTPEGELRNYLQTDESIGKLNSFRGNKDVDDSNIRELLATIITPNSEHPIRLRRLIKLARLILKSPEIAFIDEKALELENITAERLIPILRGVLPQTTFVIVLSTFSKVLNFDHIYILNDGRVIQNSTPAEALKDVASSLSALIRRRDRDTYDILAENVLRILEKKIEPNEIEHGIFGSFDYDSELFREEAKFEFPDFPILCFKKS